MPQSLHERRASSEEKDVNRFGSFRKNDYLCTRWWVIVWLVAQRRVFFDAIHSRMWNWVRLPIRNPDFPQSPKLSLYKEKLRILAKLLKNEGRTKQTRLFFLPSAWTRNLFRLACLRTSAMPMILMSIYAHLWIESNRGTCSSTTRPSADLNIIRKWSVKTIHIYRASPASTSSSGS